MVLQKTPTVDNHIPVRSGDIKTINPTGYHDHEHQEKAAAVDDYYYTKPPDRPEVIVTLSSPNYLKRECLQTAAVVSVDADSIRPKDSRVALLSSDDHGHRSQESTAAAAAAAVNDRAHSVRLLTPPPPDYCEHETTTTTTAAAAAESHRTPATATATAAAAAAATVAVVVEYDDNRVDSVPPEDFITLYPSGYHEQESQEIAMVNDDFDPSCNEAGIVYDHQSDPVFPEDITTRSDRYGNESQKTPPAHEPPDRYGSESQETTPLVPEPPDRYGNESRETPPPAHESPDRYGSASQDSPPAHEPYMYFSYFFTDDIIDHIVYQVNERLNHIIISAEDFKVFVGALIRMSLYPRSRVDQYWSRFKTYRVNEVADRIDKKSFSRIKLALPFNDRYDDSRQDDILYIYREIIEAFLTVPATPSNSVFEIPDKWKSSRRSGLFCRSSTDGFIHDIVMRPGKRTFENHHTQLDEEERHMTHQDKIVTLLMKTLENPKNSTVYSHRIGVSQKLVHTLMTRYGCRCIPFKTVSRSSAHYIDGILRYKTDLHKRTCLMDLFGYAIDLCVHNAWILYKRNCILLDVEPISLEKFRIKISDTYMSKTVKLSPVRRFNHRTSKMEICRPKLIEQHLPQRIAAVLMCAYCCARESHWMCEDCCVTFCLSEERNCFTEFHKSLIPSTCT